MAEAMPTLGTTCLTRYPCGRYEHYCSWSSFTTWQQEAGSGQVDSGIYTYDQHCICFHVICHTSWTC